MEADARIREPSRIVVVVGVDMSEVSAHLLAQTRDLVRNVDKPEIHVVHVVRPEPPILRLVRPNGAKDAGVTHEVERAQEVVESLSTSLRLNPRARVVVHTRVGDAATELAQVAGEVGADVLVVEAHEEQEHRPLSVFHRSVASNVVSAAPCTVLTIRRPQL